MEFSVESIGFVFKNIIDSVHKSLPRLSYSSEIFAFIGVLYAGKVLATFSWSLAQGIRTHILPKFIGPVNLREKYGRWAVVTGCTSGIGRAFAVELARHGMDIVLISRDQEKLWDLSDMLSDAYNVQVICVAMDFTQNYSYDAIRAMLPSIKGEIGILVNNVGIISKQPLYFLEMSELSIRDHVSVNMLALTLMTKFILPDMIFSNKGAIINLSSFSCVGPVPLLAVYAATKSYVDSFTQAIRKECEDTNIEIQSLVPFYVKTQMVDYSQSLKSSEWMVPTPELYAYNAVNTLSHASRTTGYWLHSIQLWMVETFCPRWAWLHFTANGNKAMRIEAYKAATNFGQ